MAIIVAMVSLNGDRATALAQQGPPPAGQPKATTQPGQPPAHSGPASDNLRALARAAEEWVRNNPKGKTEAVHHPIVKQNGEPEVSPEEREAIGLPAPTWVAKHGKVHPAVLEALEAQKKLIASGDPLIEFQFDRPCGFQGMAYVDVYLRYEVKGAWDSEENQKAVAELQTRVLHRLTAAEFATRFQFKESAGFIGWVNPSGFEKLAQDSDIVALALDDQARPKQTRAVEGKKSTRRSERAGPVDNEVYEAVKKSPDGYTWVMVTLNVPVHWDASQDEKDTKLQQMEDNVLSAVPANEFRLTDRGRGFCGYANAAALAKLNQHPDVGGVWLGGVIERP